MASPKPRPVVLKLLEGRGNGTDSGGRKVAQSPLFKRLPPEAPEWLPPEAKAEWDRVAPELDRLELTKSIDRAALTAYCLTWDRLVTAQQMANDHGLLGKNAQGVVRAPWVAIIEAASKDLRAWAGEFGLTPSAESKLSVQEAGNGEDDIFAG